MELNLVTKPEHDTLQNLVTELSKRIEVLEARERNRPATPKEWLIQSEANEFFIGRGGKPVHRHTFSSMVAKWLEKGDLVEGVNYKRSGDVKFISRDFLAGKNEVISNKKLKRA